MTEDLDFLRAKFRENLDTIGLQDSQVIMANAPAKNVDETKIHARFLIVPGGAEEQGFDTHIRVRQVGYVMLEVYAPKGSGLKSAYDLAEKFRRVWFKWRLRSDTGRILTKVGSPQAMDNDKFFQVNVFVPYESVRMIPLQAPSE